MGIFELLIIDINLLRLSKTKSGKDLIDRFKYRIKNTLFRFSWLSSCRTWDHDDTVRMFSFSISACIDILRTSFEISQTSTSLVSEPKEFTPKRSISRADGTFCVTTIILFFCVKLTTYFKSDQVMAYFEERQDWPKLIECHWEGDYFFKYGLLQDFYLDHA